MRDAGGGGGVGERVMGREGVKREVIKSATRARETGSRSQDQRTGGQVTEREDQEERRSGWTTGKTATKRRKRRRRGRTETRTSCQRFGS